MSRWLLGLMIVGAGLAGRLFDPIITFAADKDAPPAATPARPAGEDDPAKRIDKAIQDYENRADQELHQIRKQITQLRTELGELCDLQCDMAVSLAELQAELRVQAAAQDSDSPGNTSAAEPAGPASSQQRQRLRAVELARELRQVQETLRGIVQQKRGETDQLVIQLRNLRAQQRQVAAERQRNAQASSPSQDD